MGVILDLLASPLDGEISQALVAAALEAVGDDVDMVSCMLRARGAPVSALRQAGFVRLPARLNPAEYVLVGEALDGRMDLDSMRARERWHVSWGDFDVF